MKLISILIVDDHQVVRVGLRTLLSCFPRLMVIGEASGVADGITEAERLHPDIVLLDVRLGSESGFDVCRAIQKMDNNTKVIILTSFADNSILMQAIAAGADGYLLKEIDGDGLVETIEKVAAGHCLIDSSEFRPPLGEIKELNNDSARQRIESLSSQERKVISLVAEGKTNKEIASILGLSDKTIKNYFSNILDKLKLSRRSHAAAFYVENKKYWETTSEFSQTPEILGPAAFMAK